MRAWWLPMRDDEGDIRRCSARNPVHSPPCMPFTRRGKVQRWRMHRGACIVMRARRIKGGIWIGEGGNRSSRCVHHEARKLLIALPACAEVPPRDMSVEGSWTLTAGSGTLAKILGGGLSAPKMTSPSGPIPPGIRSVPRRFGGVSTHQRVHGKQAMILEASVGEGAMHRARRAQPPGSLWAEDGRTGHLLG